MKETLDFHLVALCLFLSVITCYGAESSTCLMVYKEGGAPAVFQSSKCPRWKLSDRQSQPGNPRCQVAVHQGRRSSQEDRILCALDVRIPFPGTTGLAEVRVTIVAVFDGHNGSEASDMASKLLLEYFILHTYFLLDATFPSFLKRSMGRLSNKELETFSSQLLEDREQILHFDQRRFMDKSLEMFERSFHLEILKESLLRTIADIDSTFSKEAYKYNLESGSTATVVLIVDGQILVANLGDSKALLCSEKYQSLADSKASALRIYHQKRRDGTSLRFKDCEVCKTVTSKRLTHLVMKELTRDHRPDRDDEKSRIEKAGGYILEWSGVPRVNGHLAVSRAIGDVFFKSFGVTSAPEVTDWLPLDINDSYLVAASDGVFEGLGLQDVCDLLWEVESDDSSTSHLSSTCSSYSLADCIINTAFERGSVDNMAAAVVPLRSVGLSKTFLNDKCAENGNIDGAFSKSEISVDRERVNEVPASIVQFEYAHPIAAKFDRLLIEGKYGYFGCYYLYENLKEDGDNTFGIALDEKPRDVYETYALPGGFDYSCGESLIFNEDNNLCFHFGMISDGHSDESRIPEDLLSFLRLLESIPLEHAESNFGSYDHLKRELKYILKKKFGRGAYGEVWLAFQWNCSQRNDTSHWSKKNKTSSRYHLNLDSWDENHGKFSSNQSCDTSDGSLFVLKRIMVERGSAVYLSGLREKYFGEIFLNASSSLGGFLPSGFSSSFLNKTGAGLNDPFQMDEIFVEKSGDSENPGDIFVHGNRTWGIVYEEGLNHIARYVESFESSASEIWLVFQHEGVSLSKVMYTTEDADEIPSERAGHAQVLHPSKWWHWMKTTAAGQVEMRNLVWQLLMALKSCHDRNITHRDIKPENMVVCFEDQDGGGCLKRSPNADIKHVTRMRIIDFGSAIDDFTKRRLYGFKGPSRAEQTYEYTPPEALLNPSWYQGPTSRTLKYDMWSVGVVFLEIVLGSPDVFQISTLSHALLDKLVEGWNEDLKELAYRLRSFMEMCILVPGLSVKGHPNRGTHDQVKVSPASWKCSEEYFSNLIRSRDPLHIGFPNVWAMRLVRQLLLWDPDDRLSADEALLHPYFQPPP